MTELTEWFEGVRIGLIGLGYVGLPLAIEFSAKYPVVGYDRNDARIASLRLGIDVTQETSSDSLKRATGLTFTSDAADLRECTVFIVAVPTPIDKLKQPDLGPLLGACEAVGAILKPGDIVVFESTVYPGCTEERCVPVLEEQSGLRLNQDFAVGYSPERINPGDSTHRVTDIVKITSGSTPDAADRVDALYSSIVTAGTHRAASIKVAEAAKVIENTQRDLNIALVNELAIIFNRMGINTYEVLEAAGTKWNFLPFRPGLVGGHCISVDPYYLTYKAEEIGYRPEIILAGRRLNDRMGVYSAGELIKAMARRGIPVQNSRVLVMGLTFKENCRDLRNSLVADAVRELINYGCTVSVYDPLADPEEAKREYNIDLIDQPLSDHYDAILVAVGHDVFREIGFNAVRAYGRERHILFDLKRIFPGDQSDLSL